MAQELFFKSSNNGPESSPRLNTLFKNEKMKPSSLLHPQFNISQLHLYLAYTSSGTRSQNKILPEAAPSSRGNSTKRRFGTTEALAFLQ